VFGRIPRHQAGPALGISGSIPGAGANPASAAIPSFCVLVVYQFHVDSASKGSSLCQFQIFA
jgi:hypothetical protein